MRVYKSIKNCGLDRSMIFYRIMIFLDKISFSHSGYSSMCEFNTFKKNMNNLNGLFYKYFYTRCRNTCVDYSINGVFLLELVYKVINQY